MKKILITVIALIVSIAFLGSAFMVDNAVATEKAKIKSAGKYRYGYHD